MFAKARFYLKMIRKFFGRVSSLTQIDWARSILMVFCLILIVISTRNIYGIVYRGYQRYNFIQEENQQLEELRNENESLQEELKYYSSYEYIEYKAREELNLVYPGSKLIYVDHGPEEIEKIDQFATQDEPEPIEPDFSLWINLIFR